MILINEEEAIVKRVYKLDSGIELVALNPAYKSVKYTFEDMKKIPVQVIGIVKQLIMIPIHVVVIFFLEKVLRKPFDKYIRE